MSGQPFFFHMVMVGESIATLHPVRNESIEAARATAYATINDCPFGKCS